MMDLAKITPRVVGARKTVALFMTGVRMSADEVTLALETLTAAGVFEEIDAVVARSAATRPETQAPSVRRRLGPRGTSTDTFLD